jgi:hypothetical protein
MKAAACYAITQRVQARPPSAEGYLNLPCRLWTTVQGQGLKSVFAAGRAAAAELDAVLACRTARLLRYTYCPWIACAAGGQPAAQVRASFSTIVKALPSSRRRTLSDGHRPQEEQPWGKNAQRAEDDERCCQSEDLCSLRHFDMSAEPESHR